MAAALSGKRILILATNGFEQSELEVPRDRLKAAGAEVDVVSPEAGGIKGWDKKDWGRPVKVDKTLGEVRAEDYDAIVLPGGQMNPDTLRQNEDALALIRAFFDRKKIVAAVCHAPWLLVETGIARGRAMTSYNSMKTDVMNAGANWRDEAVVADQGVITGVQQAWQAAIGIDGLLGSKDNLTAVGFGYAVPAAAGLRDEKSIEVFQRFQVTKFTQFTVGAQLFVDPSNAPDDNVLAVFSFRLRVDL